MSAVDDDLNPHGDHTTGADRRQEATPAPHGEPTGERRAAGRSVVQIRRGLFLTTAVLGMVLIAALGTATIFLLRANRGATDPATGPANRDGDPVVATVNGDEIRRSEYDQAVAARVGRQLLDQLILEHLVDAEASRRGIVVDDQQTARLLDEQRKRFGSDAAFEAALQRAGLTEPALRAQLRHQELLRQLVADQTAVTDQEITDRYNAMQARSPGQPLDQVKDQLSAAIRQEKEQKAMSALLEQLQANAQIETFLPGSPSS